MKGYLYLLGFFFLSFDLWGMVKEVPLGQYAVISGYIDGQPVARVVVKVDLEVLPDNIRVDAAELRVSGVDLTALEEGFTLEVYPLTTDWEVSSVSWTFPWETPGGDFSEDLLVMIPISGGYTGGIGLDLTGILRSSYPGYGLLIKKPDQEGGGFNQAELEVLLSGMPSAAMRVYYSFIEVSEPLMKPPSKKRGKEK